MSQKEKQIDDEKAISGIEVRYCRTSYRNLTGLRGSGGIGLDWTVKEWSGQSG